MVISNENEMVLPQNQWGKRNIIQAISQIRSDSSAFEVMKNDELKEFLEYASWESSAGGRYVKFYKVDKVKVMAVTKEQLEELHAKRYVSKGRTYRNIPRQEVDRTAIKNRSELERNYMKIANICKLDCYYLGEKILSKCSDEEINDRINLLSQLVDTYNKTPEKNVGIKYYVYSELSKHDE